MHPEITALRRIMLADEMFKALCLKHGLPWDPDAGYEPRWFSGPAPEETQVLMFMAEPGPITKTEARNLLKAIAHDDWIGTYDLRLQEHYWREHLRTFCRYIWPENTERNMYDHLAGSCTFWMSLPHGSTTDAVPLELIDYFSKTYLNRILALFPDVIIVAAGAKSRDRLKRAGVPHEYCWAFTRPGCNQRKAKESWRDVGTAIREKLNRRRVR